MFYSKSKMSASDPEALSALINEVEQKIQYSDSLNIEVSQAVVAWHLDHLLITMNNISDSLKISNPNEFESSFNPRKLIVLTSGIIPRGVAQSPASVRPPDIILTEDIQANLKSARENLLLVLDLDENVYFNHPVFGKLNKAQTLRFLQVHTNHHLKIVRDILKE